MRSCCTVARSHRPGRVVVRVSCVSECEWSVSPPPVQVSWFYRSLLVWPLQQLYSFFSLQLPRNDDGEEINGHSLTSGSQLSARFSNCLFFSPPFSAIVQKHPTDFLVPPLYPPQYALYRFYTPHTLTHIHTLTHKSSVCVGACVRVFEWELLCGIVYFQLNRLSPSVFLVRLDTFQSEKKNKTNSVQFN